MTNDADRSLRRRLTVMATLAAVLAVVVFGGGYWLWENKLHDALIEVLSMDRLSALIASLNEKFGLDLGEADKVWMDQQWTTVLADDVMREIALNNDKTQFEIALEHKAKGMIVERHEANGMLFDTFFSNPEFRGRLLDFLGGTYEEFRAGA